MAIPPNKHTTVVEPSQRKVFLSGGPTHPKTLLQPHVSIRHCTASPSSMYFTPICNRGVPYKYRIAMDTTANGSSYPLWPSHLSQHEVAKNSRRGRHNWFVGVTLRIPPNLKYCQLQWCNINRIPTM